MPLRTSLAFHFILLSGLKNYTVESLRVAWLLWNPGTKWHKYYDWSRCAANHSKLLQSLLVNVVIPLFQKNHTHEWHIYESLCQFRMRKSEMVVARDWKWCYSHTGSHLGVTKCDKTMIVTIGDLCTSWQLASWAILRLDCPKAQLHTLYRI